MMVTQRVRDMLQVGQQDTRILHMASIKVADGKVKVRMWEGNHSTVHGKTSETDLMLKTNYNIRQHHVHNITV
jgi:hypothetical protein